MIIRFSRRSSVSCRKVVDRCGFFGRSDRIFKIHHYYYYYYYYYYYLCHFLQYELKIACIRPHEQVSGTSIKSCKMWFLWEL